MLFTDEFAAWWQELSVEEQAPVGRQVLLLAALGPALPFPHSSGVSTSAYPAMRELRIQHAPDHIECCISSTRAGELCCC